MQGRQLRSSSCSTRFTRIELKGNTMSADAPRATALQVALSRRDLLRSVGLGGIALASSSALAACGGVKSGGGGGSGSTLKIGYVSPKTGPAAAFGETDDFILGKVRAALTSGINVGGKTYKVEFIAKDSQANPQVAASVANELISGSNVDLMLATSTPESVNPVSDACEAAGVPCLSAVVPWQAWYYGRGAKPGNNAAYKYTYHFSFGVENFAHTYISQWGEIPTNKKVGVLWPNDADGQAIRTALGPLLKQAGYTIVDPGAFQDATNDFSSQIGQFKAQNCEILNSFALPPDFATFWRQAAQQGFVPKIAQIAKTGLFPSQVEALGNIGRGLSTGLLWHKDYPYKSSLTGLTSQQIADMYEGETGRQWTQALGPGFALFDAGLAALKASPKPTDKAAVAQAMSTLKVATPLGNLDWTKGPVKNVVTNPIPGGQWVKATSGKFALDEVITENADDPNIPVHARLQPYAVVRGAA